MNDARTEHRPDAKIEATLAELRELAVRHHKPENLERAYTRMSLAFLVLDRRLCAGAALPKDWVAFK